jgi:ABC-2 type transport system ATP-binding protein
MSPRKSRPAIDDWLERLQLSDWKNRKIEALSKGMAQKVQFISTVLSGPDLIVLDEPFSGLDPVNLEVLRDEIVALRRKGTTVIFSTHDIDMAEKMCDFVFMIYRGQKVLDGDLDTIRSKYGVDTIRLRLEGGADGLASVPGVQRVTDFGRYQELLFQGDPQRVLHEIAGRARVQLFEVVQPSLRDIFIRIARPEPETTRGQDPGGR